MNSERDTRSESQEPDSQPSENPVFLYKDSGIHEKHGHIPLWLWGVAAVLLVWGIWYTVVYWSPPHH